jgi:hypothetical protein
MGNSSVKNNFNGDSFKFYQTFENVVLVYGKPKFISTHKNISTFEFNRDGAKVVCIINNNSHEIIKMYLNEERVR